MNPGQQKFHDFILQNVSESDQEEAKALLAESFEKQDDGTFDHAYLMSFFPRMMNLIKSENQDEVKEIMMAFKNRG